MKNIRELIEKFFSGSFFRFLLVGGVNTLVGYIVTLFFRYGLNFQYRLAQILNFLVCFPLAYFLQARFAFRQKLSWKNLLKYPLSSVPNWALQLVTVTICVELFKIPEYISYLISYVVPIPIMYFVVRFLVKNPETGKEGREELEENGAEDGKETR